jgi:hypothetical protein
MRRPLAAGGVVVDKANYIVRFADNFERDMFRERVNSNPHFGTLIINYLDEVPVAIVHDVDGTAISELEHLASRDATFRKSIEYAFAGK